jgi:predicted nucleic acid-binding protein
VSVYLDTNIVIYAVENPPAFGARATARLTALRASSATFMVSDLTRMEWLVGPLRTGGALLEGRFRSFFSATGIQVVAITAAVCDRAAHIRATTRFKPRCPRSSCRSAHWDRSAA